jgi:thiosulfate dehydrogenase (quinone) large subunit
MHDTSEPTFHRGARPLLVGLLLIQAFLGYEWLMSGVAKVLAGDFASSLGDTLTEQTKDLTGGYKSFLDSVVIPNGQLFGNLVMLGELALGVVLIGTALIWLTRWSRLSFNGRQLLLGLIVLSGVVAIVMNINFHLASGANHPWLIAADPNGEGVDLDSLMPIVQLIIAAVSFTYLRQVRAARTATPERPVSASAARP